MALTANWSYPTAIRFGAGRIAELPVAAKALGILEEAGLGRALFADVDPNPNEKNLAAGIAAFKAGNHDGVIAFGGGSGLDLGKLIAFMADRTRPVWISRISAIGGPAPTRRRSTRISACRPPPAPAPRWGGRASSPIP